jgi:N-acetylmuramoyl-L-alanine amidase
MTVQQNGNLLRSVRRRFAAADRRRGSPEPGLMVGFSRGTRIPKKGKAVACRIATSFAAVVMGISCVATDASATCMFKAKRDIIVILDVGHTDKDSGQISARGVKEYDLNMKLARRVLEELVNTGFISTQMIVTSGSNTHESRLQRSKRANDLGADLFISVHHDGVKNQTLMPWQYNGKTHWFLDKFEGFSLSLGLAEK